MIDKFISQWFAEHNYKANIRGILLVICSILYIFCDDHTDKIITSVMAILAIDSFSFPKRK